MPAKNSIKTYVADGVYHVYNRGVEKRDIFLDKEDYRMLLYFLKIYLVPADDLKNSLSTEKLDNVLTRCNFADRIELLAYCLMPNHFHLLLRQLDERGLPQLMSCISTNYAMYFNKKYHRVGTLFQGVYKAILVKDDDYLLHLSRYIHLNPLGSGEKGSLPFSVVEQYDYSSYQDYLGKKKTKWLKPKLVLDYFESDKNKLFHDMAGYSHFIEDRRIDPKKYLGKLSLD